MKSVAPREAAARRYRIEKYLTEGGMGAIYLGKKMGSGGFQKEVVLKQLLPEYTSRPEFRDLFFREAKISATLDHANIVHTFDLVESDQSLFIVMEYVRGADLRTILRRARQRGRELSPAAAIHIALEILNGLAYAHARRNQSGSSLSIIHRDVSPSNIICSAQGAAKLSDFGIAKASTHSSVFYRVRGKVGYMSPEQARNQPIDHRCDLYSLAVCLYESLSGERLFVGDLNTPADEIYGHVILPISDKRAGLPRALDEVLMRALATDIADRYQSAPEFSDALRTVAHRTGLAFSAPELAAHLRDILGNDPDRWLRDDGTPLADGQKIPAQSVGLVGKEAASIGIVADGGEDEPPPLVLSPSSVSGSKDFDLDSMLNDEATRPGAGGRGPAPLASPPAEAAPVDQRALRRGEPPPVWTRSSGPVPIVTPPPARATTSGRVAAPPAVPAAASSRNSGPVATTGRDSGPVATAGRKSGPVATVGRKSGPVATVGRASSAGAPAAPPAAPAATGARPAPPPLPPPRSAAPPVRATAAPLPPPPPVPLPGRIAARTTQRGMAAVPPPVPSSARQVPPPPPPRASARLPVPEPFEEATPPPPVPLAAPAYRSGPAVAAGASDYADPYPQAGAGSAPAPPYQQAVPAYAPAPQYQAPAYAPQYQQAAPAYAPNSPSQPSASGYGAAPHAQTLHGFGSGPPAGRPSVSGYAASGPVAAPRAGYPQTIDFSAPTVLPEKGSGPPGWLAVIAVAASLAGGAVLAHRVTQGQMTALAALDQPRPQPRAKAVDDADLPPRAPAEPTPAPAAETPPPEAPVAAAPVAAKPARPAHPAARHRGPGHRRSGRH